MMRPTASNRWRHHVDDWPMTGRQLPTDDVIMSMTDLWQLPTDDVFMSMTGRWWVNGFLPMMSSCWWLDYDQPTWRHPVVDRRMTGRQLPADHVIILMTGLWGADGFSLLLRLLCFLSLLYNRDGPLQAKARFLPFRFCFQFWWQICYTMYMVMVIFVITIFLGLLSIFISIRRQA